MMADRIPGRCKRDVRKIIQILPGIGTGIGKDNLEGGWPLTDHWIAKSMTNSLLRDSLFNAE